jgi:hypothetical protein
MEHILQKVTGAAKMSMVDGFSGYNQVSVLQEDREKMTFTTPLGTFMYTKMTFGLMNARENFQRAMDITMYSRSNKEHCDHLRKVFLKSRKFGLSLNPKKSLFSMKEGKLLGHHPMQ